MQAGGIINLLNYREKDLQMDPRILEQLAPEGILRVGLNMANFLLITGETADGQPDGVSPDMAHALASKLGVEVELVRFDGPGDVADAAGDNVWDIGNIAAEPERAKSITFSPAYCEIQATYLLAPGSEFQSVEDVDKPGVRIAVKERAAYDLWLTENLTHANLVRTATADDSFDIFVEQSLDAVAGLRPKLLEQQLALAGSRLLDASFTAVQQSIGCRPDRPQAAQFIKQFVQQSVGDGYVQRLIEKHGVVGKLSVAPLT